MFTGIIEGMGKITGIQKTGSGRRISVEADFDLAGSAIGDSIAVNGACLTVIHLDGNRFQADLSPETISKTTFANIKIGDRVNLERALRLSDRIDGHLVSGHIDGTGILTGRISKDNAIIITINISEHLGHYLIPKGSVAVDGISLTVNHCDKTSFDVSIIPHTASITTIGFKRIGDSVNIETDMIGKYVEKFVSGFSSFPRKGIDIQFLSKTGFITD